MALGRSASRRIRQATSLLAASAGVTILGLSREAHADTSFSLTFEAPKECPDRGAFIREVQLRTPRAVPVGVGELPDTVVIVHIERDAGVYVGHLLLTAGTVSTDRAIEGISCGDVTSALSLLAALSIDPEAVPPPPIDPLPLPPDPSGPPRLDTTPRLLIPPPKPPPPGLAIELPEESVFHVPPLPIGPLVVESFRDREELRFGFGGALAMAVGPAPIPLLGGGGHLEIVHLGVVSFSVRAAAEYFIVPEEIPVFEVESSYRLFAASLEGCIPAFRPNRWVRFWPCGSLRGGALWGSLIGRNETAEAAAPWFDWGFSARLQLMPSRYFGFEVEAGVSLPMFRGRFSAGSEPLFESAPASFDLKSGFVVELP
ncbi:MAG: hypothetical protein U0271_42865 [Polyangiaceae bacterium]